MIIEELFAFILEERPGDEGVPALTQGSLTFPLMGADLARIDSLRPFAKQIATATGMEVTLCKFSVREELEIISP